LLIRKDFPSQRIWLRKGGTLDGDALERNGNSRFDDLYQSELPSVAAIITLPNKTRIAVASNHLEPFAEGASSRANQCKSLMELLTEKAENVILIGDFNMRQKEDKTIENLVGRDAWKEGSGSTKKLKMTWDSIQNLYHENGFGFTCRFDRCYVKGKELAVKQFGLVGNWPVNGVEGDYLSDHFGLVVEVNVAPTSDNSDEDNEKVKVAAKSDRDNAGLDCKPTIRTRGHINDSNGNSKKSSMSSRDASDLPQTTKDETENSDTSASVQEKTLLRHKNQEQSDEWDSYNDEMGSEETPRRVNGKRARSAATTNAKSISMKSNNNTTQLITNGLESVGGNIKEQKKRSKVKAEKKCRFDSSSSEDDGEETKRRLQEKLGKNYKKAKKPKKRLLPHLAIYSSSDED